MLTWKQKALLKKQLTTSKRAVNTVTTQGTGAPVYPFSALVGQDDVKLALILTTIDPSIGGVLLTGEKGTAKSTAVRALADVMPGKVPVRTLPLGATEDRVAGGLDLEASITQGRSVFAPGLLADVDGGVLYIDEVNLLADHLGDLVLDVASTGVNVVEREGFSVRHNTQFVLIGTMNPEEGEVRPQLLDRFGVCVQVKAELDPQQRVELLRRRLAFDADPEGFAQQWADGNAQVTAQIRQARALLPHVVCEQAERRRISTLATEAFVAGLRADIVWTKAARAHAAWQGRDGVGMADVMAVAEFVLRHRRRDAAPPAPPAPAEPTPDETAGESPPDDPAAHGEDPEPQSEQVPAEQLEPNDPDAATDELQDESSPPHESRDDLADPGQQSIEDSETAAAQQSSPGAEVEVHQVGESFSVRNLTPVGDRTARAGAGRRMQSMSRTKRGRYVRARKTTMADDLAIDATLRAAAPHQVVRRHQRGTNNVAVHVDRVDWHRKVRQHHTSTCIVFVVDASGSMGARSRMVATKGAVLSLLLDAYQKRDKVAMVTFRRQQADVVLPPTSSVDIAGNILRDLAVGGRTPLASGLVAAAELIEPLLHRDPTVRPLVVVLSDGRGNVRLDGSKGDGVADALGAATKLSHDKRLTWVVVDTEDTTKISLGLAKPLAEALGANYYNIDELRATDLVRLVKEHTATLPDTASASPRKELV